jgi:hypothetical protein
VAAPKSMLCWSKLGVISVLVLVVVATCISAPLLASTPPRAGGTITVAFANTLQPPSPTLAWSFADWMVIRQVHSGLYRVGRGGLEADLADGLPRKVSPGRFQVRLHPVASFHNGLQVTSEYVLSMWRRAGLPNVRLVALDNRVLEFTGKISLTAERLAQYLAATTRVITYTEPHIGAGPFIYESSKHEVRLRAHLKHHLGRPWVDKVVVQHGLGVDDVREAFRYRRADIVFEDISNISKAVRLKGPIRETLGLVALASTSSSERRHVMSRAPRVQLLQKISGATRVAYSSTPFQRTRNLANHEISKNEPVRWYVGTTPDLKPLVHDLSATFSSASKPWQLDSVENDMMSLALREGGHRTWSAVLTWWYHPVDHRGAADELLKRRLRSKMWIPLVHRARVVMFRGSLRNVRWDDSGLVDFAAIWRR